MFPLIGPYITQSDVYSFFETPPFGTNSICRFPDNVADMKYHVARHFEDILQVSYSRDAIPYQGH
jgi:hypothetical protein